ncbi:MAG: hypothetical protein ABI632_04745, partial [Pseudolysinimonas sp.]
EGSATVDATGGNSGAGIGGGLNTGAGAPTIQGDATVTAQGGSGAAGIGGGGYSTLGGGTGGGAILITDTSDVTANGGAGGTGIGAVGTGGVSSIFVSGSATVSAHGFGDAVGIGAGYGIGGTVRFTDSSTTTAVGGSTAWGVGTGTMANPAEVDVEDSATLTTSGGLGSIGGVDDAFNDVVVDGELVIPVGKTLTVPNAGDSVSGDGILSGGGTVVNHGIISLPDANVTVANVTLHNYDVTFDGAGGILTPTGPLRLLASSMNSGVRSFPTGARSGFLLTGWKAGATDFNGYSTVTADVTLTAQWGSYAATLPTPLITGQAKVGHDLLADPVAANWAAGTTFSYSWLRNGVAIPGVDHDDAYTLVGADLGKQISVTVTGTNPAQPTLSKTSAKTATVVSGAITGLAGVIGGDFRVGGLYTSNVTSFLPSATYSYQWYIDGVAVSKATTRDWVATAAAMNGTVSVKVTARATGYTSASIVVLSDTATTFGSFATPPTPSIVGIEQTGHKLTAVPGTWTPKATFTYQWYRGAVPIPGATSSTLTLPSDAMSTTWMVRVVGRAPGYQSVVAYSSFTGSILGTLSGATPKITGTAKVGRTLTAVSGAWTSGTTLAYQWVRVSGSSSTDIGGATGTTYVLTAGDRGKTIKLKITGSNAGFANLTKTSSVTTKVV